MKDRVFVDTNIYIYFLLVDKENSEKKQKAQSLIKQFYNKEIIISVQVLHEIYNTLFKKYKIDDNIIRQKLNLILSKTILADTNLNTLEKCWEFRAKYNYSYWDSLIIASAIQADCSILYTEDLHDNQQIEKQLRIINPLK